MYTQLVQFELRFCFTDFRRVKNYLVLRFEDGWWFANVNDGEGSGSWLDTAYSLASPDFQIDTCGAIVATLGFTLSQKELKRIKETADLMLAAMINHVRIPE